MKNQFIYFFEASIPGEKPEDAPTITQLQSSFNVNKVIRSMTQPDGKVVVILDDFNERVGKEPDIDLKTNKLRGYKNVRETVQSEIVLNPEDGRRFFNLISIE